MLIRRSTAVLGCIGLHFVQAQTSLYIPGFDPQPVSADVIGVGSDGRTTWALHQGQATDTQDDSGFPGTATLVEGPNDASLTYADPAGQFTIAEACTISSGIAVCTVNDGTDTEVQTETASPFLVQGGSTVAASASASAVTTAPSASGNSNSGSSANTSSGTKNTGLSSGPSQTSGTGSAASQTSTPSGAMKISATSFAVVLSMAGILIGLM